MRSVQNEDHGLMSRLAWKIRPTETLRLDSVKILDSKFVAFSNGSRQRVMALMRIRTGESSEESKFDYSAALRSTLQQQRMRGLFDGLHRAGVPFLYMSMMTPSEAGEDDQVLFEFDLVVGTWVDMKQKQAEDALRELEQRASVLAATMSVALPKASVRRLNRSELRGFLKGLLLPSEPNLPQSGDAAVVSSLGSFNEANPAVDSAAPSPRFYVPNAAESGRTGIMLGRVKSDSGELHDFRLQLDDLKRHVAILGMTGSGKSTTALTIVKQIAEMGLPVAILDWHNEYGSVISGIGGRVVSPGSDDFRINPIEPTGSVDPVEHVAMVTDIFSDIYRFSHPQAYMFRNALQKRLSESAEEEIPNLGALVRTIEAYPLRSAYDNETKVALLRRLVPLTQGQAGRALNGPSTFGIDELLGKVVCVELGQLRDSQTRSIFTDIILKMIYEQRMQSRGALEHITVVEEARNVAPARRAEDPPSVGERMIAELRKFGEAMIFVAQFPTQVASEMIKNSGARIVHRIAWPEDVNLLGDSLSLSHDQREHITRLQVGEAVVSLARIQKPLLVQVKAESVLAADRRDLSFSAEE